MLFERYRIGHLESSSLRVMRNKMEAGESLLSSTCDAAEAFASPNASPPTFPSSVLLRGHDLQEQNCKVDVAMNAYQESPRGGF